MSNGISGESMRPLYETKEHVERETALAMSIEAYGTAQVNKTVKLRKMPIKYGLDFAMIVGGRVIAFAELKCRKYSYAEIDSLGGYMLDLMKITRIIEHINNTGLPVHLFVELKGEVYHAKFTDKPKFKLVFGGRNDRDDWQDNGPMGLIPMSEFKKLDIVFRDKQPVAAE